MIDTAPELLQKFNELSNIIGFWRAYFLVLTVFIGLAVFYIIKNNVHFKKISELIKVINNQSGILVSIRDILDKQYGDNFSNEQISELLESLFTAGAFNLISFVKDILDNNSLEAKKDDIEFRVNEHVEALILSIRNKVGKFKYKGQRLIDFFNIDSKTWSESLVIIVLHGLYKEETPIRKLKFLSKGVYVHFENMRIRIMESIDL